MGRDVAVLPAVNFGAIFQSTLPAWGETNFVSKLGISGLISIHSPRMGRDRNCLKWAYSAVISIHSPRMGRDPMPMHREQPFRKFQSTLPAWGETFLLTNLAVWRYQFQSTLPAWGETRCSTACPARWRFQSTLPAWGETRRFC